MSGCALGGDSEAPEIGDDVEFDGQLDNEVDQEEFDDGQNVAGESDEE